MPAAAIRLDDANTRIPVPTETGNLIVHLPGREIDDMLGEMFADELDFDEDSVKRSKRREDQAE